MPKAVQSLPLFPLETVIYPGGILPLRVFETRYLDMVKLCTSSNTGFGICLLMDQQEKETESNDKLSYQTAKMAAIGTQVEIIDFDSGSDGVLQLIVRGQQRFQVSNTRVQHNGLIMADVEWLPKSRHLPVRPEHGLLVDMLQHLHTQVEQQLAKQGDGSGRNYHPALDCDYDDAENLGFRLAELLPISLHDQQVLLEIIEPEERLNRLLDALSEDLQRSDDKPPSLN